MNTSRNKMFYPIVAFCFILLICEQANAFGRRTRHRIFSHGSRNSYRVFGHRRYRRYRRQSATSSIKAPKTIRSFSGKKQSGNSNYSNINESSSLLPQANLNKNPVFPYKVYSTTSNRAETCGGNLISRKNNKCVVGTAAHCLYRTFNRTWASEKGYDPELGAKTAKVKMETQAFGIVDAQAYISDQWKKRILNTGQTSSISHDVGALVFDCDDNQGRNIPVVPLATKPLEGGENVLYGLIFGAWGLFRGAAHTELENPYSLQPTVTQIRRFQGQPFSNYGDSGGGMYRQNGSSLELVGLHSGFLKYSNTLDLLSNIIEQLN